jgi:hypothetical protein
MTASLELARLNDFFACHYHVFDANFHTDALRKSIKKTELTAELILLEFLFFS